MSLIGERIEGNPTMRHITSILLSAPLLGFISVAQAVETSMVEVVRSYFAYYSVNGTNSNCSDHVTVNTQSSNRPGDFNGAFIFIDVCHFHTLATNDPIPLQTNPGGITTIKASGQTLAGNGFYWATGVDINLTFTPKGPVRNQNPPGGCNATYNQQTNMCTIETATFIEQPMTLSGKLSGVYHMPTGEQKFVNWLPKPVSSSEVVMKQATLVTKVSPSSGNCSCPTQL